MEAQLPENIKIFPSFYAGGFAWSIQPPGASGDHPQVFTDELRLLINAGQVETERSWNQDARGGLRIQTATPK